MTPQSAQLVRIDGGRAVYRVSSETYLFTARNVRPTSWRRYTANRESAAPDL